jgi:CubicO group peptidase (beta-lactamase class C family)
MTKQILFFLLSLLIGTTSFSQDKTSEIDKVFSWANAAAPGCACAVSQNGKVILNRGYGSADLEREVLITPNSIFDAGSLTKQFVAAATLLLVEEGKLSLTEDIHKYIPQLPDYGHKITVDNLLTHTSGIRDWIGMLPLAPGDPDALTMILRQRSLNGIPGEEWSYTNSGFVLLKEIVARASGMSFDDFTRKRLFDTLGMKSTAHRSDLRTVIKNRALAYDKIDGRWKMAMMIGNDRGGGAIFSTASDLLTWNDALTNARLGKFVTEKLQEQTTLNNGRKIDYGRGLFLGTYRGAKEIWHTGSAEGYKSWLGRYPEHEISIAIMCNSGDGTDRTAFAHRIFDLLVPNAPAAQPGAPPIPTDTAGMNLDSKAGLYFNEQNGQAVRLAVDRGRLRVVGGPGFVSIGKDRFKRFGAQVQFMSQDQFELHFVSPEQLELKSMEGKITKYRRAKTYSPTPGELKTFAGRYQSDELGTVLVITPGQAGLTVLLEHEPGKPLQLRPVDSGTFNVETSMMFLRFVKDKAGKVVAIDYNNPLIRNMKFKRLGDTAGR